MIKDDLLSFCSGGTLVSITAAIQIGPTIIDFSEKAFVVFALGVVGGFAGLAGKDIYVFTKKKYKQWRL